MRKQDIKLGHSYTDGKGNVRRVIDEGPHCRLYKTVENEDGIRYRVTRKGKRSPRKVGDAVNNTRASLAAWARYECDDDGQALK